MPGTLPGAHTHCRSGLNRRSYQLSKSRSAGPKFPSHVPSAGFRPQANTPGLSAACASLHTRSLTPQRGALLVSRAAKSSTGTESWQLGSLVLYEKKDGRIGLGLVEELQGKKNAFVLDAQSGKQVSIPPKQVVSKLGGGPYKPDDLGSFQQAASQAVGSASNGDGQGSPLAGAWELAVTDNVSFSLSDLADLVFGNASPKNLYVMFSMLSEDKLYFKAGKKDPEGNLGNFMYTPNSEEAVQQKQREMEEQRAADAERARWAQTVKTVMSASKRAEQPSREEWMSGPYVHRVKALEAVALAGDTLSVPQKELALAQESLALAGINPPSANPIVSATGRVSIGSPLADKCSDLLVDLRVMRTHEPLRLLRRGVTLDFPQKLEEAAKAVLESSPEDACASIRLDLTHIRCYTIDDASTTEVDDGISVTTLDGKDLLQSGRTTDTHAVSGVRIWVHVADPTRCLMGAPGSSELLEEAASRTRSMYLPWGSIPMFPSLLSSGPFSLRDGEVCEALSVSCAVDDDGSILDVQAHPSYIRITHKLTYTAADGLIASAEEAREMGVQIRDNQQPGAAPEAGGPPESGGGDEQQEGASGSHVTSRGSNVILSSSDVEEGVAVDLRTLGLATKARRAYRRAGKCIEIPLPEANVSVPEEDMDALNPRVNIQRLSQWESASRLMIAEMMILAGEGIGKYGIREGLPLPYRAQPEPELPSQEEQNAVPEGVCRGYMFRKCMTKSTVAPVPSRHAALGINSYVQLTSPIRRYMDVVAHMNLKAHLCGAPLPSSASAIEQMATHNGNSEKLRTMSAAERAENAYWVAEYFRQRKKEGVSTEWPATVLGWQKQELKLASVMLDELGLEVVIKVAVDVCPGDYLMLGLLEARPLDGLLRFYVTDYMLSGGAAGGDPASTAEDVWPSATAGVDEEAWPSVLQEPSSSEDAEGGAEGSSDSAGGVDSAPSDGASDASSDGGAGEKSEGGGADGNGASGVSSEEAGAAVGGGE